MVKQPQIGLGSAIVKLSEIGIKAALAFMDALITKEEFDAIQKIVEDAKERAMKEFFEE